MKPSEKTALMRAGLGVALAALTTCAAACYSRGTDHTVDELPQAGGEPPPRRAYGTTVHLPFPTLGVTTSTPTARGRLARIPCATCHAEEAGAPALPEARRTNDIHVGIQIRHGALACDSCHRPPAYSDFRSIRADPIEYAQSIELCSQCHGGQRRDYEHGAHGGMAGYWDLDQGGRDRNHCLVCHDPHRPGIPKVAPAPLPRYRFTHTGEEHSRE